MIESRSDSKRLAKNTLLLYARTLIMMFIGFFTSRVVLNALGIENYGINNVVAGFEYSYYISYYIVRPL